MASTYLTKTYSGSGNRQRQTMSVWIKRSTLGTNTVLFSVHYTGTYFGYLRFKTDDTLQYYINSPNLNVRTNAKFRDTSGWYHIVCTVDTTLATSDDRIKLYVNGERQTLQTNTQPSQNAEVTFGDNYRHDIGGYQAGSYFGGSMSHFHFVTNTAYQASTFGSTDATTGEWKINTNPTVTYATNSFFLLKDGNSVTDQSGQSNNYTVGGGTLTKTEDNPSNNFATMIQAAEKSNYRFFQGNTTVDGDSTNTWKLAAIGTIGANSGKYYWEIKLGMYGGNTDYNITGVVRSDKVYTNSNVYSNGGFNGLQSANSAGGLGIYSQTGASMGSALYIGGSSVALTNGDIVMYALDLDNRKMWAGKNGVWANAGSGGGVGNPSTGANELWGTGEITAGEFYLPVSIQYYNSDCSFNFGNGYFRTTAVTSAGNNASNNGIFEYDVPTGFSAWSTKGLNL